MRAIHRPRRRAFKIYGFAVIAAAMARTFEFVLARLPVRRAPQMGAASVDYEEPIGGFIDPDAIELLVFGIDSQRIIAGKANLKSAGGLSYGSRQKEPDKHQKAGRQKTGYAGPHDATSNLVYRWIGYRLDNHGRRFRSRFRGRRRGSRRRGHRS